MKVNVLAIIDRPSKKSFAMLGFVGDTGHSPYPCFGYDEGSRMHRYAVRPDELETSIATRSLLDVRSLKINLDVDPHATHPRVAAWVGNGFRASVEKIGMHIGIPGDAEQTDDGTLWFTGSDRAYANMTNFIESAAHRVFDTSTTATDRQVLAELMHWTIPTAPETLAAVWHTQTNEVVRERELALQLRALYTGPARTVEELKRVHQETIAKYQR